MTFDEFADFPVIYPTGDDKWRALMSGVWKYDLSPEDVRNILLENGGNKLLSAFEDHWGKLV